MIRRARSPSLPLFAIVVCAATPVGAQPDVGTLDPIVVSRQGGPPANAPSSVHLTPLTVLADSIQWGISWSASPQATGYHWQVDIDGDPDPFSGTNEMDAEDRQGQIGGDDPREATVWTPYACGDSLWVHARVRGLGEWRGGVGMTDWSTPVTATWYEDCPLPEVPAPPTVTIDTMQVDTVGGGGGEPPNPGLELPVMDSITVIALPRTDEWLHVEDAFDGTRPFPAWPYPRARGSLAEDYRTTAYVVAHDTTPPDTIPARTIPAGTEVGLIWRVAEYPEGHPGLDPAADSVWSVCALTDGEPNEVGNVPVTCFHAHLRAIDPLPDPVVATARFSVAASAAMASDPDPWPRAGELGRTTVPTWHGPTRIAADTLLRLHAAPDAPEDGGWGVELLDGEHAGSFYRIPLAQIREA